MSLAQSIPEQASSRLAMFKLGGHEIESAPLFANCALDAASHVVPASIVKVCRSRRRALFSCELNC